MLRVGGRAVAAISRNIARTGEIIGSTLMADTRFISSFIDSIERNALTATEREVVRAVQRTLTSSTEERALAVAADGWFERTMNAAMRGERAPFSSGTTGGFNRWLMDAEFPANMHPANDFFVPPSTNFTRMAVGADELAAFQRELDAARTVLETEGPVVRSNPFDILMAGERSPSSTASRGMILEEMGESTSRQAPARIIRHDNPLYGLTRRALCPELAEALRDTEAMFRTNSVSAEAIDLRWISGGGTMETQGMRFENYIATQLPENWRLTRGFETFDFWSGRLEGKAISVKTLDTNTVARLSNPRTIYSDIKGYIDEMLEFSEATYTDGSGRKLTNAEILSKELCLGVPSALTEEAKVQIARIVDYGKINHVDVTLYVIR